MSIPSGLHLKSYFLAVLALLLLAGVAVISFHSTMRMSADAKCVDHTHEAMAEIEKLVKTVSYDAVSHRGFLITGDEAFLAKHQETILDRSAALERLSILIADDSSQRERLAALAAVIEERENLAKNHVELRRREGFERVQRNVATGRGERMLERVYSIASEMSDHERTLLKDRAKQSDASARATRWAIVGASSVAFLLVGGALWWLTRELLERRKSDAALRKSEERFRALVTAISEVVYQMGPDWGEMRQLQSGDFLAPTAEGNRNWLQEYIHPDDQVRVMAAVHESIRSQSTFKLEHRVLRADGSVDWRISRAVPIRDSNDKIVEWFGASSDVTARKRAEQALKESEKLLHQNEQFKAAVLDAIPAEIALLDRSGVIITVNEPWLSFGRKNGCKCAKSSGLGANYLDVCAASSRSGYTLAGEVFAGIEAVLSGRLSEFYLEYPCDSPTEKHWFLMHAVAAPADVGGAVIAHTDITRLKQVEQALSARTAELETVMQEVPVAIFIAHGAGSELITTNPAGRKLLRLGEQSNIAPNAPNIGYRIFRDGQELTPEELPMQLAAATGEPVFDTELEVVFSDGASCRTLGNAVPLFDENGAVTGSLGTFIDISERKAAEEALRNFNTKLAESVVERTKELRSTVQVLENEIAARRRLEGEILKLSESEQTRLGQDLHDNLGQQLAGIGMLSQVLSSQLREESHPGAVDAEQIARCLTESISTTRNLAKSFYPVELERGGLILALQDFALRTQLLSKISCNVNADTEFRFEKSTEIHLYRIVQESINNAIKHGKATHIQIDCLRKNEHWSMTVTDNGTGFTAPESGCETGMGLPIFQYRATLIGAEISVRRGTPDGCIVACSIPVSPT